MRAVTWFWEQQEMAELNEDPPTEDLYYVALEEVPMASLISFAYRRIDDDADAKSITNRVTLDDIPYIGTRVSADDNTWYYGYLWYTGGYFEAGSAVTLAGKTCALPERKLKIELRQNDAPGANAELDMRIQYAIRKEV